MVKVRFAPSPTGIPHVGNIRTALFDFCFAKANGGIFVLRIEDTDQARKIEGAVDKIQESLAWLGASWDEFVTQSERLDVYKKHAQELVEKGLAREDDGAIRFVTPSDGKTSWVDAIGNKEIVFENKDVEDFIILKKDGFPTYHLANVIDDHIMEITHVIRGEDWISSAPKHIMLYEAFGWNAPVFAHVPNVLGTDGKKLSKRKGAKSVLDFKTEGILPEALFNYLMLLGWSPKNDREILQRFEIEKEFKLENINTAPAIFDERKLLWMNGEYIREMVLEDLKKRLLEFNPSFTQVENFDKLVFWAQTRMKTLADFANFVIEDENVALNDKQELLRKELLSDYSNLESWTSQHILEISLEARNKVGASTKDIYIVLTGRSTGLPFNEKIVIDGREKTLSRLRNKT